MPKNGEAASGSDGMTDTYNDALAEQTKKNVFDTLKQESTKMTPGEYAEVVADIAGIFDPTPVSDGVGLALAISKGDGLGALLSLGSMIPYAGDALAKPLKIAKRAPMTAKAVESLLKAGDKLAVASKAALKEAGLSLEQVAAARAKAMNVVQRAMLDAKNRVPNCVSCKLVGEAGEKRQLHMPVSKQASGRWSTPGGKQPADGNGIFVFDAPKELPNGTKVREIEFKAGAPDFDKYVEGAKHDLWEVSGDAVIDGKRLTEQMREVNPKWRPPDKDEFVLHHFEDGKVGYVPRVLHDKVDGGVAHTGGNSMTNNQLF